MLHLLAIASLVHTNTPPCSAAHRVSRFFSNESGWRRRTQTDMETRERERRARATLLSPQPQQQLLLSIYTCSNTALQTPAPKTLLVHHTTARCCLKKSIRRGSFACLVSGTRVVLQRERTSFASIRVGSFAAGSFLALPLRLPSPPGVSSEREKVTQKEDICLPTKRAREIRGKRRTKMQFICKKNKESKSDEPRPGFASLASSSSQTSNHRTIGSDHPGTETRNNAGTHLARVPLLPDASFAPPCCEQTYVTCKVCVVWV